MPPAPRDGRRVYPEEIVDAIHQRFDPADKKVVTYYEDAANNQLYIDTARLTSLGFSLNDVKNMVERLPYFAAVFTEDDVRAAQSRLPAR